MRDPDIRWMERVPWWDIALTAVPLLAIVSALVFAGINDDSPLASVVIAITCLALVTIAWWSGLRRFVKTPRLRVVTLLVISALMVTTMILVPPLGILQGILFPLVWVCSTGIRESILWSGVIAAAIAFGVGAAHGTSALVQSMVIELMSFGTSVAIGVLIVYASQAAERSRALVDELRATQEQLREASHEAGVATERERISRELHDTLAQTLTGMTMLAEQAARGVRRAVPAPTDPTFERPLRQLDQVAELSRAALAETRALIAESAPTHDSSGLTFEAALRRLTDRFDRETELTVALHTALTGAQIDRDTQVVLLRCAQEGLANVRRHARAAAVRLCVENDERTVTLRLADDGVGFDPDAAAATGFGLPSLRERARLLGGEVEVDSAPDAGTTITVRLPLRVDADAMRPAVVASPNTGAPGSMRAPAATEEARA